MKRTKVSKFLTRKRRNRIFSSKPLRKRQILRAWDMECTSILQKIAKNMTPETEEELLESTCYVGVTDPPERTLEKIYNCCSEDAHQRAEALKPRPDGKQICKYLSKIRLELAKANNIPFTYRECLTQEPCAGTCAQCDAEAAYLNGKMQEIAPEDRVYPRHILQKWEGTE